MSAECPDRELLREYLRTGSDGAFQKLVATHARMVIATAQRVTSSPDSAEEIAQNVFIQLAKKAHWLAGHESLAGWLHRAAVLEARQWLRSENRRLRREQHAYETASDMQSLPQTSDGFSGLLDDALLQLPESDRQLVVLRHCEGRSYPEIARILGLREDAVRKRCDRAMTQVAGFFKKRGIAAAGTAAIIAGLDSSSAALSPAFAITATKAALAAAPIASSGLVSSVIAKVVGLTKVQTAALALIIATVPLIYEAGRLHAAGGDHDQEATRLSEETSKLTKAEAELRQAKSKLEQSSRRHDAALVETGKGATQKDSGRPSWVDGLKFARIPKSMIASIPRAGLDSKWRPRKTLRQMLGLTPAEDKAVTQALAAYTAEIGRQNEAHMKRMPNNPADETDAKTESATFAIESRHEDAVEAARTLEADIHNILDPERAKIALNQFSLPLLPGGTTDYENYPDVDNSVNNQTAICQGIPCRIVFIRDRGQGRANNAYSQIAFTPPHGGNISSGQRDFTAPVLPPSLAVFWRNWKAGTAGAQP